MVKKKCYLTVLAGAIALAANADIALALSFLQYDPLRTTGDETLVPLGALGTDADIADPYRFELQAVPEPPAYVLLLIGLAVLRLTLLRGFERTA